MDKALISAIKKEADELICETHPEVCSLRDSNFSRLQDLVIDRLSEPGETISIQTALAEIEQELSHL